MTGELNLWAVRLKPGGFKKKKIQYLENKSGARKSINGYEKVRVSAVYELENGFYFTQRFRFLF